MGRGFYFLLAAIIAYATWTHWLKPSPHLDQWNNSTSTSAQHVQVKALETYAGEFRILSREDYSSGTEAQFSPVDFAVGWGDMARPEVYSQIEISQSNRWYHWHVDHQPPIPVREIETHSANMHIIPANAEVAKLLKKVKPDDMVYLQGALVEIQMDNGWHWRSSLSREDTGAGACELMRVDQVRWL
ncbi:MAG: hypothetical protein EOO69_11105 [Moraxellaceae bacterium]|nr:MAG: hypothetical protein EOO69_11105 [Moraxellaceae bacterium]